MTDLERIFNAIDKIQVSLAKLNDEYGQVCVRLAVLESQMEEIFWRSKYVQK